MRRQHAIVSLLVRGVDNTIALALKARAARYGRSAEAEHRATWEQALAVPRKRSFAEVPEAWLAEALGE